MKWHNKAPINGRELTSDDVVYSFEERFKQGGAGATFYGRTVFDHAEAVDPLTVKLHLKMPYANFLEDLYTTGWAWIVPRGHAGPDGKEWLEQPEKSWIGTGPFMFKEHQPGVKTVFEKNPNYFQVGQAVRRPSGDADHRRRVHEVGTDARRIAGRLSLGRAALRIGPEAHEQRDDRQVVPEPIYGEPELPDGPGRPGATFGFVRPSQWQSTARRSIKTVLHSQDAFAGILWPLDPEALKMEDFPPEYRKYLEYRPDEAKALLAQAGFPNGFSTKIIFTPIYGSPWNELSEAIVTMLRGVGIQADMELMEYGAYIRQMVVNGEFDAPVMRYANRFSISDMAGDNLVEQAPGPWIPRVLRRCPTQSSTR